MLDINYIRDNQDAVRKAIKDKCLNVDFDVFLRADKSRKVLLQKVEQYQSMKNDLNEIMKNVESDEERQEVIEKGRQIKAELEKMLPDLEREEKQFKEILSQMPTVPAEDVPIGKNEDDNVVVQEVGEKKKFDFTPKTHMELGEELDMLDFDRGVKVSGFRGYFTKNDGAALIMAMMMYAFQKMVQKGFAPMIPPTIVKEFALYGSGYFKGTEYDNETDEVYQLSSKDKEKDGSETKERKFLAGTAEPALLAYHSGEVLEEKDLPLKYCGYSPCYRSEIGSYGKDTKGMYRVHEFFKIEQVVIATADLEKSEEFQREMIAISEEMHEELGLSYRKLAICTGDMGAGKYRMYDLEAWLPGMNRWGETGSASNFLDWQSRRLNVTYKDEDGKKKHAYMLNNTALPSPRILIAIMENYQQEDGSILVPDVLQPFMPVGKKVIEKR